MSNWQHVRETLQVRYAPQSESPPETLVPAPIRQQVQCQTCQDTRFVRRDVPVGHPDFGKALKCQACWGPRTIEERVQRAYLPDDFLDRTFQSYLELVLSPEQRQAAEQVETFVRTRMEDYRGKKRGLYLFGSWGVGKTGLAISALGQALAAGKSGLYLPTTKLFASLYDAIAASERMRAGYGDDEDRQEESMGSRLLRQVEQVEWLVLDDLGVECASCFVISKLYQILEERQHQMGLYTIFTSNKDARSLLSHWRPEGRNVPAFEDAERIMQRIGEHCMSLHLMGHSLRERH